MAETKTRETQANPIDYIAAIADESRRSDCEVLLALMSKVSRLPAVMWGTSIVGFGVRKYPLAGGKQGEICAVGFSSRKGDISIYGLTVHSEPKELLAKLGKHKLGKGCLYVAALKDIDLKVLENLVAQAVKSNVA